MDTDQNPEEGRQAGPRIRSMVPRASYAAASLFPRHRSWAAPEICHLALLEFGQRRARSGFNQIARPLGRFPAAARPAPAWPQLARNEAGCLVSVSAVLTDEGRSPREDLLPDRTPRCCPPAAFLIPGSREVLQPQVGLISPFPPPIHGTAGRGRPVSRSLPRTCIPRGTGCHRWPSRWTACWWWR